MTTPPPAPDWYPDPSGKPGLKYSDGQQWHAEPAAASSPSEEPIPRPTSTTPRHHTALIVALIVALVVLVGIVGITGYLLLKQSQGSQTSTAQPSSVPTVQPGLPSGQTTHPAAPSSAMAPSTASAPGAEVPGLAPFLGHWGGGHSGGLDIHPDGTGRWTYSDTSTCPNAPLSGCGVIATVDFTLTSVATGTATGSVTAASNPKNDPLGEPVTIVLGTRLQGKGVVLAVSISKMRGWSFCNETSPHYCAES